MCISGDSFLKSVPNLLSLILSTTADHSQVRTGSGPPTQEATTGPHPLIQSEENLLSVAYGITTEI